MGGAGRALPARDRPRRRARGQAAEPRPSASGSPRELDVPVQYGGGLRDRRGRARRRSPPARTAWSSARPRTPTSSSSTRASRAGGARAGGDRRPRRPGLGGRLDEGHADAPGGRDRADAARGVRQFVYTNVDRDGMLEGPDLDEVKRIAEVIRGRFLYSGGIGSLDDLRGLCSLRLVNLAGRDLGQGAVRGPLHDRRGPRGARCCLGASSRASTWTRAASSRAPTSSTSATRAIRSSSPSATRPRAPTSSSSSTSPPRTRSATRSSSSRGDAPTTSSSPSRSAAASGRRRTRRPCSTPAPTRCRSTRPRCAGPSCSARWPRCSARSAWCWRSTRKRGGRRLRGLPGRRARPRPGSDAVEWAREGAERGAGEILLTSMDRDGTEDGYELDLTRAVADAVDIPVIASGGAGELVAPRGCGRAGRRRRRAVRVDLPLRHLPRGRGEAGDARGRHPRPAVGSEAVRKVQEELRERIRRCRAWSGCCRRSTACRRSTWSAAPSATSCSASRSSTSTLRSRATARDRARARRAARRRRGRRTSASAPPRCARARSSFDVAATRSESYEEPGALPGRAAGRPERGPRPARLRDQRDGGRRSRATSSATCTTRTADAATSTRESSACCTTAASSTTRRASCARVRYEVRLDFRMDEATEELVREAARRDALATVSGPRDPRRAARPARRARGAARRGPPRRARAARGARRRAERRTPNWSRRRSSGRGRPAPIPRWRRWRRSPAPSPTRTGSSRSGCARTSATPWCRAARKAPQLATCGPPRTARLGDPRAAPLRAPRRRSR